VQDVSCDICSPQCDEQALQVQDVSGELMRCVSQYTPLLAVVLAFFFEGCRSIHPLCHTYLDRCSNGQPVLLLLPA
jgi:hypothetical protein